MNNGDIIIIIFVIIFGGISVMLNEMARLDFKEAEMKTLEQKELYIISLLKDYRINIIERKFVRSDYEYDNIKPENMNMGYSYNISPIQFVDVCIYFEDKIVEPKKEIEKDIVINKPNPEELFGKYFIYKNIKIAIISGENSFHGFLYRVVDRINNTYYILEHDLFPRKEISEEEFYSN